MLDPRQVSTTVLERDLLNNFLPIREASMPPNQSTTLTCPPSRWARFVVVIGPGLVVMLADTDAGSIITAAQSGAQWGYRLLMLQLVLVHPIIRRYS